MQVLPIIGEEESDHHQTSAYYSCQRRRTRQEKKLICVIAITAIIAISVLIGVFTATDNNKESEIISLPTPPPSSISKNFKKHLPDVTVHPTIINQTSTPSSTSSDDEPLSISPTLDPSTIITTLNPTTRAPSLATESPTPTTISTLHPTDDEVFTSNPTVEASTYPTEQLVTILAPISGEEKLNDGSSPQYAALHWLAEEDTFVLDFDQEKALVIERYISSLLYFSTSGSTWRQQHGFLSPTSVCEWNDGGNGEVLEGLECNEQGRLTAIVLDVNALDGTLNSEFGNLEHLETLSLGSNSLGGSIPTQFGQLSNLKWLSLSRNYLVGSAPSELGNLPKLESLLLFDNSLIGSLPSSLSQLSALEMIFIEGNAFTGTADGIFCHDEDDENIRDQYERFYSDCRGDSPEISCTCCTHCCNRNGAGCKKQQ